MFAVVMDSNDLGYFWLEIFLSGARAGIYELI
jgi:hypothetical protein